ncbi:MAG TPA: hypothetical protein VE964_03865 [Myxococcales bacterium]|nr:hypothetical protein [Myxococcales bacterium]
MKALLFCALFASGCAGAALIRPRPALVFDDSSAPLAWRADTGSAPREVHGEACRYAVGLPLFLWGGWDLVGWAHDGYREAVAQAQAQAPGSTLSDVRADIRFVNVLVFRKECLEVTAAAR